jgi:hypothetical protein
MQLPTDKWLSAFLRSFHTLLRFFFTVRGATDHQPFNLESAQETPENISSAGGLGLDGINIARKHSFVHMLGGILYRQELAVIERRHEYAV